MDQITNIRYHILVSATEVLTKDDIYLLQTRKGARLNSFTTILKQQNCNLWPNVLHTNVHIKRHKYMYVNISLIFMLATVYRLLQDVDSCLSQSGPICPADSIGSCVQICNRNLNKAFKFSATPILTQPYRWPSQPSDNGDKGNQISDLVYASCC